MVEKDREMERKKLPLTQTPGAEPDAPELAISRDPDVIKVYQATQAEPMTFIVDPLEPSEGWGKTASTEELNEAAAVRFLVENGMLTIDETGGGTYIATATDAAKHPDVVKQIAETISSISQLYGVRPVKIKLSQNLRSDDEDQEGNDEG